MNFNETRVPDVIESSSQDLTLNDIAQEALAAYRDPQTGLVGVNVVIRPSDDDPLLVFADPNYCFQKKLFIQVGLSE